MEVIGLWSWQTYHTVRCSPPPPPCPLISSVLPLVWRFLFYIITDNIKSHTHRRTVSSHSCCDCCVSVLFFWHRKKICVIIIKVAGLSYVWLDADSSLLLRPLSSLCRPSLGSVWSWAWKPFICQFAFVVVALLPEIRSTEIMSCPQRERKKEKDIISVCSVLILYV